MTIVARNPLLVTRSRYPWLQGNLRSHRFIGSSKNDVTSDDPKNKNTTTPLLFLHVGPSGDCWTGPSIFAAKHLQPDYVKSIPLPAEFCNEEDERVVALLEAIANDKDAHRKLYDEEKLPQSIMDHLRQLQDER
jgi:hypothetical protein